jgi:hypothetical protein
MAYHQTRLALGVFEEIAKLQTGVAHQSKEHSGDLDDECFCGSFHLKTPVHYQTSNDNTTQPT